MKRCRRVGGAEVVVAVPARNERARLGGMLAALAAQQGAPPFALALLLDGCDDGSAELIEDLAPARPFPVAVRRTRDGPANVGRARRAAAALAAERWPDAVLMTTDADSAPAPGWIAANLAGLRAADVVAGRIVRRADADSAVQSRLEDYYDRLHALRRTLDPVAWEAERTHHWTSGASMAMRAATYHAAGGFPALASGEDAAFADAAARLGLRLRRDATAEVVTSSRRTGRAPGGLAAQLRDWDTAGRAPSVAHPADEAWRYLHQAEARRLHARGRVDDGFARRVGVAPDEVLAVAGECPNGEAFAARIVGAPPGGMRAVSLPHAEALLAALQAQPAEGAA